MLSADRNALSHPLLVALLISAFLVQPIGLGPIVLHPPTAFAQTVPIPALAQWQTNMVTFGKQLCAKLAPRSASLLGETYYDSEQAFYLIADYTGNTPMWNYCAHNAQAVYRDGYVIPSNGRVPGYWNFTAGLRMDYERTGDPSSKNAVFLLSTHQYAADGVPLAWTVSADRSREVAYAILSLINAQALGQAPRKRRIDLVNQAYGHLSQWFVNFSWPGPWQQSPQTTSNLLPFMVGLTADALIRDWEQTHDSRLIPALMLAADWLWAHAWILSAQAMWYEFPAEGQPCCVAGAPAPDLNLLIAPIYAFLYWQTGITKYRDEGDQIFVGGVRYAWFGDGKHFDQNYWWSFDYVKWRSLSTHPLRSSIEPRALSPLRDSPESPPGIAGFQLPYPAGYADR